MGRRDAGRWAGRSLGFAAAVALLLTGVALAESDEDEEAPTPPETYHMLKVSVREVRKGEPATLLIGAEVTFQPELSTARDEWITFPVITTIEDRPVRIGPIPPSLLIGSSYRITVAHPACPSKRFIVKRDFRMSGARGKRLTFDLEPCPPGTEEPESFTDSDFGAGATTSFGAVAAEAPRVPAGLDPDVAKYYPRKEAEIEILRVIYPRELKVGDCNDLAVRVVNMKVDSGPFEIQMDIFGPEHEVTVRRKVESLGRRGQDLVEFPDVDIPARGTYDIDVVVDPDEVLIEGNRKDNVKKLRVRASGLCPPT